MKKINTTVLSVALLLGSSHLMALTNDVKQQVVEHYATIAHAVFEDALTTGQSLNVAIDKLLAAPSDETLAKAKRAWKAARVPYQQSEVFRFGNANVDDWEGQLNAWPLDEGLIDYVAKSYKHEMGNVGASANIIASKSLTVGNESLDLSSITPPILANLNELAGSEANVATGYHAIEFLLWGQDLNETSAGAGNRPYTDFVEGAKCTNANCDRRREYLKSVTTLLVSDLSDMTKDWASNNTSNYRAQLLSEPVNKGLVKMLYGAGSLSLGELAGERMKVALEANSPEDEHDCFSDNTHFSHFYNAQGVQNVYLGRYQRVDGSVIKGPSLSSLVAANNTKIDEQLKAQLVTTEQRLQVMVDFAERKVEPMKFDQIIAPGNAQGEAVIHEAISSLVAQTQLIEEAAKTIGISNLNPDTADHDFKH